MASTKAIYYGQVKIIPGISCDGYVLEDGTAVMSERGTAKLLGMDQKLINRMRTNSIPKILHPFIDEGLTMRTNFVKVLALQSPYYGRKIVVYSSKTIESLIRGYVLAFAHNKLRKNPHHIGQRCTILLTTFVQTALDSAIKEACGINVQVQKTSQKYYKDAIDLLHQFGFHCSTNKDIATKKDIVNFLQVPMGTLNSFLYKHNKEIHPVKLDSDTIQQMGSKAKRLNGYHISDVAKIAFGMDTAKGIELKEQMFGEMAPTMKITAKDEIQWRKILAEVFSGFDLRFNHSIDHYRIRVDFFIADLLLCLECNGYCHRSYDENEELRREKIITQKYALLRFHHKISLQTLFNGILHIKPKQVIRLYDI